MPHIVIGDPKLRVELVDGNGRPTEVRHAVIVRDSPDELVPGDANEIGIALVYWPDDDYSDFISGATFTVREGPNIIGFGEILEQP